MAPFEALYGRPCRSSVCWKKVELKRWKGPQQILDCSDKINLIKKKLLVVQSRQKSYVDKKRRAVWFEIGDHVFLKVSLTKGVMRFEKKGKLSPRYIRPFEVLGLKEEVAYELALPPELSQIYLVFHISMLKKYVPDPSHVIEYQPLDIQPNLTYEEKPIHILGRREQVFENKGIPYVKVL